MELIEPHSTVMLDIVTSVVLTLEGTSEGGNGVAVGGGPGNRARGKR